MCLRRCRDDPSREHVLELLQRERLREVVIHSGRQAAFPVAAHGVGRQRDDGSVWGLGIPLPVPDSGGCCEAIHDRHLAIHENEIKRFCGGCDHGLLPILRDSGLISNQVEHFGSDLKVDGIVFDEEHAAEVRKRRIRPRRAGWRGADRSAATTQPISQQRLPDGFPEPAGETERGGVSIVPLLVDGAECEEFCLAGGGIGFDGLGEHQAVHLGHVDVEDGQTDGGLCGRVFTQQGQRGGAGFGDEHLGAPGGQVRVQNVEIHLGVVDHQDLGVMQEEVVRQGGGGVLRGAFQLECKAKGRTLVRRTRYVYVSAHEVYELFDDRETEARSSETSGGGSVRLGKRREQSRLCVSGNSSARVGNIDLQRERVRFLGQEHDVDRHVAGFRELDGVPDQVEQDLPQSDRIADDVVRNIVGDIVGQLQPFLVCLIGEEIHGLFNRVAEPELDPLEFHLAGLDLGVIQDVIEDVE